MSRVLVVLVTYNGERYLRFFLDSLCAQALPVAKVIAVDDGSSDASVSILESYREKLPLSVFPQKGNRGHRAAFALGLELAQKETSAEDCIALADQDDIWFPDKLKILSDNIGDTDLIFGDAEVIGKNGEKIADSWRALAGISTTNSMKEQIAGTNNVTGCLSLFRAALILPIPGGVSVHDRWMAMLAQKGKGCKAITDKVLQYRLHKSNAIGLGGKLSFLQTLRELRIWLGVILTNADRLNLSKSEHQFSSKLLALTERRLTRGLSLRYLPWILKNRRTLFSGSRGRALIKKILFTTAGIPVATRVFGKK